MRRRRLILVASSISRILPEQKRGGKKKQKKRACFDGVPKRSRVEREQRARARARESFRAAPRRASLRETSGLFYGAVKYDLGFN